ncbi:hypothetical protein PsP108CL_08875 [Pseudomonas syringae]|nr:hypothetical protein [Pseudomonas syringae]
MQSTTAISRLAIPAGVFHFWSNDGPDRPRPRHSYHQPESGAGYPGAYWICTMTFGVLFDEDERQLTSLIGKLQGMYGTVNIPAITRIS